MCGVFTEAFYLLIKPLEIRMNRMSTSVLVLLFAALALGPWQEAVAQTASPDYAEAEEPSDETAAPELSYETQVLMGDLEEQSYEQTLNLRLGYDQSLSALRAGTYRARDVFFRCRLGLLAGFWPGRCTPASSALAA